MSAGPAHRARTDATAVLAAAEIGSPAYDAAELLAFVLGVPRGLLPLSEDLTQAQADRYAELVARRAAREPLQHLLGTASFYGVELQVGAGVFVPRPETELLVESALRAIGDLAAPSVIDLCSGSGAIAIAIATRRPTARTVAVEQSAEALGWLRGNVDRLAPAIQVLHGDVLQVPVITCEADRFDLVTCNPPYVPTGTAVSREVAEHDPSEAVFAGADGLALIRPLVPRIAQLLHPGGVVLLEHDETHQDEVLGLFAADGSFTSVTGLTDLTGRARFILAHRR